MANSIAGKWGHSADGEMYEGAFDTKEGAESAAREYACDDGDDGDETIEHMFIGQYRAAEQPEHFISGITAERFLEELVEGENDYSGDWAEDWPPAKRRQYELFAKRLKTAVAEWLDEYGLRPTWGMIDESAVYELTETKNLKE